VLRALLTLAAVLLLAAPAAASGSGGSRLALLVEMNRVRDEYGLPGLTVDVRLQHAARAHSREMLASGSFEHGDLASRMVAFDIEGTLAGENLAWGTGDRGTAQGIVLAWLQSPSHRANLLRPSFTRVGIADLVGPFQGQGGAHVVTADFAG
jgi:uncharacterized protein YkwD